MLESVVYPWIRSEADVRQRILFALGMGAILWNDVFAIRRAYSRLVDGDIKFPGPVFTQTAPAGCVAGDGAASLLSGRIDSVRVINVIRTEHGLLVIKWISQGFPHIQAIKVVSTRILTPLLACLEKPLTSLPREVRLYDNAVVSKIAESIHQVLDFGMVPVLADALEEAGGPADMIGHLRSVSPCPVHRECDPLVSHPFGYCRGHFHVRGCWAIESCRRRP